MLEAGTVLAGRYRVERELGRGGLGVVYACQHIHTGQQVALKLLLAEPQRGPELEAAVREKFKLEQKVWSHAPSEHIVRVLDAGKLDASGREAGGDEGEGTLYMVMELLHGETLQERVERMRLLPPAEVTGVLQQIAIGLDVAHGCRGPDGRPAPIVHRDLTPRNVFITTRPDGSALVKLLDFGIAKHLVEGALVTQVLLGTRLYSAPEQLLGHPISPQTDVWALGLIAYYGLTGREYGPLGGPQPVSPSRRRREQGVGGRFPIEFDRWFLRCVERDPTRRFVSAGEAAAELAVALAGAEQLVPSPLAEEVRPSALVSTVPQVAARPEVAGTGDTVRAVPAVVAERLDQQPARMTIPLQHAAVSAPAEGLLQTAAERHSLAVPKKPATTGSPRVVDVEGSHLASSLVQPRRVRWAALALAAAVAGAALYVAWPQWFVNVPESRVVTSELTLTPESNPPQSRSQLEQPTLPTEPPSEPSRPSTESSPAKEPSPQPAAKEPSPQPAAKEPSPQPAAKEPSEATVEDRIIPQKPEDDPEADRTHPTTSDTSSTPPVMQPDSNREPGVASPAVKRSPAAGICSDPAFCLDD